jgi:chorismate mutase
MKESKSLTKQEKKPLVIAGPCSAETEAQVMDTARQLAAGGQTAVFRAGIWKPRTQPGCFEGIGEEGLRWLSNVKQETGLPVATEVANARHVAAAMKHGVDVLWLGARTTANPFAVQEIADALAGTGITVWLKNPVVPDLALWMGGIERIQKAGVKHVGVIHRGFPAYRKACYRNQPLWQIPIALKRHLPELPLLCDPSHIGGRREYLPEILQKAADLDYDGWMIEVHARPNEAWSDAQQQITPEELLHLLAAISLRSAVSADPGFMDTLRELRLQIDLLDEQLLDILAQRMKLSEMIGRQKKTGGVTILQTKRRDEILQKALERGRAAGLSPAFIEALFELLHQESIDRQTSIMND